MADDSIMGNMPKSSEGTFGSEGFGRSADASDGLAFRATPASQPTAEQLAYQRGQQDMLRRVTTPRMTGWRIACGICWAFWTVAFGISAIVSLSQGARYVLLGRHPGRFGGLVRLPHLDAQGTPPDYVHHLLARRKSRSEPGRPPAPGQPGTNGPSWRRGARD